jgi:hypothetical protein
MAKSQQRTLLVPLSGSCGFAFPPLLSPLLTLPQTLAKAERVA